MTERSLLSYDNLVHAVSGATGSVVAMATFYPLDTVRCRLQLESPDKRACKGKAHLNGYTNGDAGPSTSKYCHMNNNIPCSGEGLSNGRGGRSAVVGATTWREMQRVMSTEGVSGLYKGMVPVLQSLCASNFVYFYTFHGLRSAWCGRTANGVKTQSAGRDLMLGAMAGAINVMVTTPLWVVNTRLKMPDAPYKNLHGGLVYIARKEGIKELWAGAFPSLLLVVNPALQFMVYESIKRRIGQMSAFKSLLVGAVAKAVATVITYPLQVAQAHLRHRGSKAPGKGAAIPLLLTLFKERGLRGVYRGLEAKLLQTVLTAALMFATYEKIARFVFSILHRHRRLIKHAA